MFEISVQGKLKIEDAVEFLDKEVTIIYNGKKVPKLNERSPLKKCLEWIRKAKAEGEGFNRFFALWISYNILYDFYHWKEYQNNPRCISEKRKIRETVRLLNTQEMRIIISQNLQVISNLLRETHRVIIFERGCRELDIKAQLEDSLKKFKSDDDNKESIEKTFENLLLFLYGMRNNLFHGRKNIADHRQEHILNYAYEILLPILSLMLIKLCLGNA